MTQKKYFKMFLFAVSFSLWILLISFLWKNPKFLFGIMLIISASYFSFFKKKNDFKYFLVASIAGPVGEAIVSKSGLWTYHGVTVFGIPYWLPLAWGITAVMIKRFLDSLV